MFTDISVGHIAPSSGLALALLVEVLYSTKILANFCQTTWHHISEDITLHVMLNPGKLSST
jgi:hypothetical protein